AASAARTETLRLAAAQLALPFDLSRAPLLRVWLVRLGGGEHALLYAMHHVISDGWSMGVLLGEIAAAYAALAGDRRPALPALPALPVQYADFAVWQRAWFAGGELKRQLDYWRERLAGAPITELPADRPRPNLPTYRGRKVSSQLPAELAGALAALARERRASLFMVLLAGFDVLVGRYTGADDVVLGTPIANRRRREIEGLIGFFVNTLVLRTDLAGDPSFAGAVDRAKAAALGAFAHQDLPFERLVEELAPRRDLARNPLFQLMFNLVNTPVEGGGDAELTLAPLGVQAETALFDLQVYLYEAPGSLSLAFEYATALFEHATIERLARAYRTLLEGAVARPERRISDLPLLAAAERAELVAAGTGAPASELDVPVHEAIAAQAARTPRATAVVAGTDALTYGELERRAGRLAQRLRRLGAGVESKIGIAVERSLALPIAALAVLRSGANYVPLDAAYPVERLAFMAADAGIR